jgi:hypothetical protein
MKTNKLSLRIETLEDRNMLSASPLGNVAVLMPEPTPIGTEGGLYRGTTSAGTHVLYQDISIPAGQNDPAPKIVLRWEKIAVPVVEEAKDILLAVAEESAAARGTGRHIIYS